MLGKKIFDDRKVLNCFNDKNCLYLRDVFWPNLKKSVVVSCMCSSLCLGISQFLVLNVETLVGYYP